MAKKKNIRIEEELPPTPKKATVGSMVEDSAFQLMQLHKQARELHAKNGRIVYILQRKGEWVVQSKRREDEDSRYYYYKDGGLGMFAPNIMDN